MLPSTTTGTAFKTLAIISLIFFKQEHFYHFQELSTHPVSFRPSSIIFFTSKKKKYTFLPLPVKMKLSNSLDTKIISSHAREHVHCTPRQTASKDEEQRQRDLSLRGQIHQTEPQLWKPWSPFITQFVPVNNLIHDALVKDKQDLQPLALCLGSDNN